MNLRRATGHSGLTEEHTGSQAPFTGVAFRGVTDTLRELGQELDDGLSSPVRSAGSSFRQRSFASQSGWSSTSGHDTIDYDGLVNIELEEYVPVAFEGRILLTALSGYLSRLLYIGRIYLIGRRPFDRLSTS